MSYITRGDANKTPDMHPVEPHNIIGRVTLSVPYLGYAMIASKNRIPFFFLILLPTGLVTYGEIKKIITELAKRKQKLALGEPSAPTQSTSL